MHLLGYLIGFGAILWLVSVSHGHRGVRLNEGGTVRYCESVTIEQVKHTVDCQPLK